MTAMLRKRFNQPRALQGSLKREGHELTGEHSAVAGGPRQGPEGGPGRRQGGRRRRKEPHRWHRRIALRRRRQGRRRRPFRRGHRAQETGSGQTETGTGGETGSEEPAKALGRRARVSRAA